MKPQFTIEVLLCSTYYVCLEKNFAQAAEGGCSKSTSLHAFEEESLSESDSGIALELH